jgi:hypothetical protein
VKTKLLILLFLTLFLAIQVHIITKGIMQVGAKRYAQATKSTLFE